VASAGAEDKGYPDFGMKMHLPLPTFFHVINSMMMWKVPFAECVILCLGVRRVRHFACELAGYAAFSFLRSLQKKR
jgi:hypothetical protein